MFIWERLKDFLSTLVSITCKDRGKPRETTAFNSKASARSFPLFFWFTNSLADKKKAAFSFWFLVTNANQLLPNLKRIWPFNYLVLLNLKKFLWKSWQHSLAWVSYFKSDRYVLLDIEVIPDFPVVTIQVIFKDTEIISLLQSSLFYICNTQASLASINY